MGGPTGAPGGGPEAGDAQVPSWGFKFGPPQYHGLPPGMGRSQGKSRGQQLPRRRQQQAGPGIGQHPAKSPRLDEDIPCVASGDSGGWRATSARAAVLGAAAQPGKLHLVGAQGPLDTGVHTTPGPPALLEGRHQAAS